MFYLLPAALGSVTFNGNVTTATGVMLGVTILSTGLISLDTFSFIGGGARVVSQAPPLSPDFGSSSGRVGATSLGFGDGQPSFTPLCVPARGCAASQDGGTQAITVRGLAFFLPGSLDPSTPFATETWTLSILNATAIEWAVSRTFAQAGALRVSRLALALEELGPVRAPPKGESFPMHPSTSHRKTAPLYTQP